MLKLPEGIQLSFLDEEDYPMVENPSTPQVHMKWMDNKHRCLMMLGEEMDAGFAKSHGFAQRELVHQVDIKHPPPRRRWEEMKNALKS